MEYIVYPGYSDDDNDDGKPILFRCRRRLKNFLMRRDAKWERKRQRGNDDNEIYIWLFYLLFITLQMKMDLLTTKKVKIDRNGRSLIDFPFLL